MCRDQFEQFCGGLLAGPMDGDIYVRVPCKEIFAAVVVFRHAWAAVHCDRGGKECLGDFRNQQIGSAAPQIIGAQDDAGAVLPQALAQRLRRGDETGNEVVGLVELASFVMLGKGDDHAQCERRVIEIPVDAVKNWNLRPNIHI